MPQLVGLNVKVSVGRQACNRQAVALDCMTNLANQCSLLSNLN